MLKSDALNVFWATVRRRCLEIPTLCWLYYSCVRGRCVVFYKSSKPTLSNQFLGFMIHNQTIQNSSTIENHSSH